VAHSIARHTSAHTTSVLVDLTRHGGLRHRFGLGPAMPGISEIHAGTRLDACLAPIDRRLLLVAGQRDPSDWTTVTDPGPIGSALAQMRARGWVVVCDLGSDLEGFERTGSLDVADRHLGARTAAALADAVVLVTAPHGEGLWHAAGTVRDLMGCGVALGRVAVVIARAPRRRARRSLRLRAQVMAASVPTWPPNAALVLPERRLLRRAPTGRPRALPGVDQRRLATHLSSLARSPVPPSGEGVDGLLVAPGSLGVRRWPAG
jgi:hypothetical protein